MASAVAVTCLPLTNTVGVPVTFRLVPASATSAVQSLYFSLLTQVAKLLSVMPAAAANAMIWLLVSPSLPSFGWLAYMILTNSWRLPASEAQPAAPAARVEYRVPLEAGSRNDSGGQTSFAFPSVTSWLTASPAVFSNSPQSGHMKSRYTSIVAGPE